MSILTLFSYVPAADGCDPAWSLKSNDEFEIQCAGRSCFILNRYGYEVPGDASSFYSEHRGTFKTLTAAANRAIKEAAGTEKVMAA